MHLEAIEFLKSIQQLYPNYFTEVEVIDIGSGDINGNNHHLFIEPKKYIGVDVVQAPNVNLVCKAKDIPTDVGLFDTVISSECFEHDNQIFQTLHRILSLVKPSGLFVFTCASTDRAEHGTRRSQNTNSYSQQLTFDHRVEWYANYYQNLTMDDIAKMMPFQAYFSKIHMEYNVKSKDLYFYGIRNEKPVGVLSDWVVQMLDTTSTDKNSSFHNYGRQYSSLLERFKYKNIRMLEIGVYQGQSLSAWRNVFPNAYSIVGIDIDANCKRFENLDNGCWVEIGSQDDPEFLLKVCEKHGPFDLILDDGSHINSHVFTSFETLFPLLNNNGLYIVEDTICYKVPEYLNRNKPNHLEYFWSLTKHLNQWRYNDSHHGIRDNCIDPFKILKTTSDPLEYGIDRIEFGCSYIAIHKLLRTHWIPQVQAQVQSQVQTQANNGIVFIPVTDDLKEELAIIEDMTILDDIASIQEFEKLEQIEQLESFPQVIIKDINDESSIASSSQ